MNLEYVFLEFLGASTTFMPLKHHHGSKRVQARSNHLLLSTAWTSFVSIRHTVFEKVSTRSGRRFWTKNGKCCHQSKKNWKEVEDRPEVYSESIRWPPGGLAQHWVAVASFVYQGDKNYHASLLDLAQYSCRIPRIFGPEELGQVWSGYRRAWRVTTDVGGIHASYNDGWCTTCVLVARCASWGGIVNDY